MTVDAMRSDSADLLCSAEQMLDRGDLDPANVLLTRAEALGADPDRCAAGRWMCAMYRGDFDTAWRESDAIRARAGADPHRFWTGEDIRGRRVIVRCLHGLGDAVQMMRYAPALRDACASVTFEVPPALLDIAPWFDGVANAITWGEGAPRVPPAWDVQIEVTELPYLFRTTVAELPAATNYLCVPNAGFQIGDPSRRMPRVGLVWASGEWNPSRSLPFTAVQQIVNVEGAQYWNLQGGARCSEWDSLAPCPQLRDARSYGEGIAVLARVVSQLDLVITVDTLAAHLAGAMGVPAWVMLQHVADWRWMQDRRDTPWYPSLRLYRQTAAGDWSSVVSEVKQNLASWLKQVQRSKCAR